MSDHQQFQKALGAAIDEVIAPMPRRRLTLRDIEKKLARQLEESLEKQVAQMKADGVFDHEILRFIDMARASYAKEIQHALTLVCAWDRDGFAVVAPESLQ